MILVSTRVVLLLKISLDAPAPFTPHICIEADFNDAWTNFFGLSVLFLLPKTGKLWESCMYNKLPAVVCFL